MTEIHMRKTLGGLEPCDGFELPKMKLGDVVKVNVTKPRNLKHHRKYFALINLVFQNQEFYESPDDLRYAIQVATGHCKIYENAKGHPFYAPRSISFASMDQTEFDAFYQKVISLVCNKIIPGLDEGALKSEIESMVA